MAGAENDGKASAVDVGSVLAAAAVAVGVDKERDPAKWAAQVARYGSALLPVVNQLTLTASAKEITLTGTIVEVVPRIQRRDGSPGTLAQIKFRADVGTQDSPHENLWIDLKDADAQTRIAACQALVNQKVRVLKRTVYRIDRETGQPSDKGHGQLIWVSAVDASGQPTNAPAPAAPAPAAPAPAPAPAAPAPAPAPAAPAPAPAPSEPVSVNVAAPAGDDPDAVVRARIAALPEGDLKAKVTQMIGNRATIPPAVAKAVHKFIDDHLPQEAAAAPAAATAPATNGHAPDFRQMVLNEFAAKGITAEERDAIDAIISLACGMSDSTLDSVDASNYEAVIAYVQGM